MEHLGKEKKPYHGIWIPFILMLILPAGVFCLLYFVITRYQSGSTAYAFSISLALSFLVGFLFAISCLIAGFLHDQFVALAVRIKDTHDYYGLLTKEGIKYYFGEFIHDGGPIVWIFFIITIALAVVSAIDFVQFFQQYYSMR